MKLYFLCVMTLVSMKSGFSQDAYSVESQTKGLSIAATFGRLGWSSEDLDSQFENGFYYGFHAGFGFNHQWAVILQIHFASIATPLEGFDNYPYFEACLGPRYYFNTNTKKWRPFLGAHVNYTKFTGPASDLNNPGNYFDLRLIGYGVGLSAGAHYYLNSQLSLFGMLKGTYGKSSKIYLNDFRQEDNYTFTSLSYGIGVSYHISN